MNTPRESDLDTTLQRLTAEQVASAPATPPFGDVLNRASSARISAVEPSNDSRRGMLAAAAGVLALVAGLAVVTRNDSGPESVASVESSPSTDVGGSLVPTESSGAGVPSGAVVPVDAVVAGAGRPLTDVDELGRNEWVVSTVTLDGLEFQYANSDHTFQTVHFGSGQSMESQVVIGIAGDVFAGPGDGESMTIAGATWEVQQMDGFWNATHRLGSVFVSLSGRDLDDASGAAIIESLLIVTADEMTIPPLASPVDQTLVGAFDGIRGTTMMSADGANGWYSTSTQSSDGSSSSGDATPFQPADVISRPASGGFGYADGATVIEVETSGIVSAEVATVEVEFIDGSIVTVEPTDVSGSFGVKFYAVTAEVALGGRSPDRINSPFVESRAFDAAGELIGSHRPGDEQFASGSAQETAAAEVGEPGDTTPRTDRASDVAPVD